MASLVLGAVGSYFGGPIGYMIGSALGAALFPPPGQDGPRLSDLKVQNSTYGATIPVVYGTYRVAGNVIWAAQLVEHAHETDSGSGGGGITTYTYTCSFAVSLCEGPHGVRRIWADGKLIYDVSNFANPVQFKATSYKLYTGTETQLPDPTIETDKGVGNVPAYRGQAYWVFADLELGKYGNRLPNLTFEMGEVLPDCPPLPIAPTMAIVDNEADSNLIDPNNLTYITSSNEFWVNVHPTSGGVHPYIRRLDADTFAVKGTIPGGGSLTYDYVPEVQMYDPVHNKVWGTGADTLIRYDCVSNAEDLRVSYLTKNLNGASNPITLDPTNGTPWLTPGYDSSNLYWVYKVNPITGAIDASYLINDAVNPNRYAATSSVVDKKGDCWFVALTNELLRAHSSSAGTVTVDYTDGLAYPFYSIAYDKANHSIWIAVALNDPSTTNFGSIHWEFRRFNIALNGVDKVITNQQHLYFLFMFDQTRNLLWREAFYGEYRIYGFCGQDGEVIHNAAELTNESGLSNYSFVTTKPGNNIYCITGLTGYYQIIKYSWIEPASAKAVILGDVVVDISTRVGLSSGQVDAASLVDLVDGFCIANSMAGRSAIEPLAHSYFFESVESDGKVKFIKRGGPPVVSVPSTSALLGN